MIGSLSIATSGSNRPFFSAPREGMKAAMARSAPPTSVSDGAQELVAIMTSIAKGDRVALRPLYDRTSAKLYGICVRLLGDREDAEDVLQNIYVTVWSKAQSFDPDKASVITWLSAIARNKSIDRLRQRKPGGDPLEAAAELADDHSSALEVLEQAQDRARLHDCLDGLDAVPREMIRAAFLDGATYPQLAERQDVPLSTMKSWIRRGLLRLRKCMGG
jgi:RNA polymerase sigma factor (sigma-70 family)